MSTEKEKNKLLLFLQASTLIRICAQIFNKDTARREWEHLKSCVLLIQKRERRGETQI